LSFTNPFYAKWNFLNVFVYQVAEDNQMTPITYKAHADFSAKVFPSGVRIEPTISGPVGYFSEFLPTTPHENSSYKNRPICNFFFTKFIFNGEANNSTFKFHKLIAQTR
jgi:hypothetical protein